MKKKYVRYAVSILLAVFIMFGFMHSSAVDDGFLNEIAHRTFRYFWEQVNTDTGLIFDSTGNHNASNSVIGFGLGAICIAIERGWITYEEGYARVLKTLQSFVEYPGNPSPIVVEDEHGHHYHWVENDTGKWIKEEGIY